MDVPDFFRIKRTACALAGVLLLGAPPLAAANTDQTRAERVAAFDTLLRTADSRIIVAIEFVGNDRTRPHVIERRMALAVGDTATAVQLEKDRQAIQNLGLFKQVTIQPEPRGAGLALQVIVDERWYLLPIPRVDFNSDRELTLGMDIEWANLWGLNHSLDFLYKVQDQAEDELGKRTTLSARYTAPFVGGSDYDDVLAISDSETPVTEDVSAGGAQPQVVGYLERRGRAELLALRRLGDRSRGIGWRVGGGLAWADHRNRGDGAPPAEGMSTAVVVEADYRDLQDNLFSLDGVAYGGRLEVAKQGVVSDFDMLRTTLFSRHVMPVGDRDHQTFAILADLGSYHSGPGVERHFSLGGGDNLRAFEKGQFEGDAFWRITGEFQRPIFGYDSLAGLVIADIGATHPEWDQVKLSHVNADIGIGVRWRVQSFVDFAIEIGYSVGLTRNTRRLFGGSV